MRKILLIALLTVFVAAPIVLIATVLYTPLGLSLIATQLHRLEPLGVRIEGLSGTLLRTVRIDRFELDHPSVHIVSHDIVARINPRVLVLQTLHVPALSARDTLVEIRKSDTPPSTKPMRFLPSFLRVDVSGAVFTGLRYVNIDGTAVDATMLSGNVRISPTRLRIRDFRVEAPKFELAGNGQLLAGRPLGLELRVDGNARLERGTEIAASAQTSGDLDRLAIQATVLKPDTININALLTRPENSWHVHGQIGSPAVSLQPWMENPPVSFRNIALILDWQPTGISARGNIGIPEWSERDMTIDVAGRFAKRVLTLTRGNIGVNGTEARAQVTGTLAFTGDTPDIDARAAWTNLQWPLDATALVASPSGKLTLKGPLPYDYSVDADVALPAELLKSPEAVNGHIAAHGVLERGRLVLNEYALTALEGSVNGKASLQFKNPRAWSLVATSTDLNPASLAPNYPGKLSFHLEATGEGLDQRARFAAALTDLKGSLRGQQVNGGGKVQRTKNGWIAQDVSLRMGDARLSAHGTLDKQVDAALTFSARNLSELLPDAHGSVNLTASVRGPVRTPRIIAELDAQQPGYGAWHAQSLKADTDLDLGGVGRSQVSVIATNVGQDKELFAESLSLTGNGVATQHQLEFTIFGIDEEDTDPHSTLRIDGRYADATWSGTVQATAIAQGRRTGAPLVMKEPGQFLVSRDRLSLDKFCFTIGNGQFCADGRWQRNGPWEGALSGYEIPIAVLLPPAPTGSEYLGRIEGRVHVSGAPNQPWLADAGARIIDAAVIHRPSGGEPETLNLGNGGLSGTATAESVKFSLGVQAFQDTFLYANAHIDRNGSNDLMHLPLTGDIRGRAADANILPLVFPDIDNAAGLLTAEMDVKGTLAQPELSGKVQLTDAAFDSYRINLALRHLNLVAQLQNNEIGFNGSGNAGDGKLQVGGRFSWSQGKLRGNLDLNGQNLLVADLPEYRVVASPDLKFAIEGQTINVAGDVLIPEAAIKPVHLGSAVQASDDARYVGDTEEEIAGKYIVHSEVRIRMGDNVRVDSFGLQGRIVGGVGTTVHTGAIPVGRGQLSVADGRYDAYGQKLDITRGTLQFDGTPLSDPMLDIEAQRKVETIIVGLHVRGTLKDPRFTFFSDPSMPQTQIMSYLLVGKGIDGAQSGSSSTMSAETMSVQGAGMLASQLGTKFGLEQVGVESTTEGSKTNTSLVLGKFLSPRLFISYGISLTESINTFKMRYTISDRWILKMEAGEVQSADAEYTIER